MLTYVKVSLAVAVSQALGDRPVGQQIFDVFIEAGFEPDISLADFKTSLQACHVQVKEEFYGRLKEVMPLLRFGIFLNRLEGIRT